MFKMWAIYFNTCGGMFNQISNQHTEQVSQMRFVAMLAYVFLLPVSSLHFEQSADQNMADYLEILILELANYMPDGSVTW